MEMRMTPTYSVSAGALILPQPGTLRTIPDKPAIPPEPLSRTVSSDAPALLSVKGVCVCVCDSLWRCVCGESWGGQDRTRTGGIHQGVRFMVSCLSGLRS